MRVGNLSMLMPASQTSQCGVLPLCFISILIVVSTLVTFVYLSKYLYITDREKNGRATGAESEPCQRPTFTDEAKLDSSPDSSVLPGFFSRLCTGSAVVTSVPASLYIASVARQIAENARSQSDSNCGSGA